MLDLLPGRNADTVASWLERYPGIEIIARDRAGVYAEDARRGAPPRCNAGRGPLASSPEPGRSVASGRRSPSQGGQRRAGPWRPKWPETLKPSRNHRKRLPRSLMACAGRDTTSAVNSMPRSLTCGVPACRRDRSRPELG
ncbi:hypothetical protein [Mesorhizobium sp. M0189]|uniref:hypothetical protein n=1 Tax=Mesorhizobium sp. M0189 TaxID=2956909 RepID=UPI00333BC720